MAEMTLDEYNEMAAQTWGDKVIVTKIDPAAWDPNGPRGETRHEPYTQAEMDEYGARPFVPGTDGVIVHLGAKCVCCGAHLDSYFEWGIVHGVGYCSYCKQVQYRLYHRPRENTWPVVAYSVQGWNDDAEHWLETHRPPMFDPTSVG